MDGSTKIATAIVAAMLLFIGYREFERRRDEQALHDFVAKTNAEIDAAERAAKRQVGQWTQKEAAKKVADTESRKLHEDELCIAGTVVLQQQTSTEKKYTQRLENGRVVQCSGRYRLTPRP